MKTLLAALALLGPGLLAQAQQLHVVLPPNPPPTGTTACHPFNLAVTGDGRPHALVANGENSYLSILLNTPGLLPTRAALPGAAGSLYPNPARDRTMLVLTGRPPTATRVQDTLSDALSCSASRR